MALHFAMLCMVSMGVQTLEYCSSKVRVPCRFQLFIGVSTLL